MPVTLRRPSLVNVSGNSVVERSASVQSLKAALSTNAIDNALVATTSAAANTAATVAIEEVIAAPEAETKHADLIHHAHGDRRRLLPTSRGVLYSGSTFNGTQTNGDKATYNVKVEIKHVDLAESTISGYLHIKGLTEARDVLSTFFEGEIIDGDKHSFLTRKWDANQEIDRDHWEMFPQFDSIRTSFNDDGFEYSLDNQKCIFMRWKEIFLLDDPKLKTILGASFSGFYYICFDVSKGSFCGFYYHDNCEMYQVLELKHVAERTSQAFEFR